MSTETQRAEFFTWSQVEEMASEVHISDEILQAAQIRLQSLCNLAAQSAQSSELAALKADMAVYVLACSEQAAEIEALKAENEALKAEMTKKGTAIRTMLAALEESVDLVADNYNTDWRHGVPTRHAQLQGKYELLEAHRAAIELGKSAMQTKEAS